MFYPSTSLHNPSPIGQFHAYKHESSFDCLGKDALEEHKTLAALFDISKVYNKEE